METDMNYKKLKDWNSGLVNQIIRRHPNGFTGGTVTGERGTGKSMYCYKVLAKTYYELNGYNTTDDEEEAYKEALKYMIFEPETFMDIIYNNKKMRNITPAICLDDASVHFNKYLYLIDPLFNAELLGIFATARTAITGLLINCPKRNHLTKFLREYDDYKINIIIASGGWNRFARCYRIRWYPDEVKFRVLVPFQDKYSCYIPDPYYTWYMEKKLTAETSFTKKIRNRQIELKERRVKKQLKKLDNLPEI